MSQFLPPHLRKYIVTQNYDKYTPVDQAVWRYILRQLKSFLSRHAHESYVEGLEKTGIEIERIPKISDISAKIEKFGWRALPVSGFIPPAAFMELQALGVLPIASDMRTLDHLLYTPAPDIVHEAAGHAPILIHPEFADYLRQYAQVAKKAIISKEDLDLYEAIRDLSDIKESSHSTAADIEAAEKHLEKVSKSISHISEAAELSRMNWWTAEYGLIGSLDNPKIYGAGLLSSVGESRWCLSEKVKKIPLTVKCIEQGYDITEPQPQLFVSPDFKHLVTVLEEMAAGMAFRLGGIAGLRKALQARSVNTAELDSGLQISGVLTEVITAADQSIAYLKFQGPSQLSFQDKELPGHGKSYHAHGFGTPIGNFVQFPQNSPCSLTPEQWMQIGVQAGSQVQLEYTSGVKVTGQVKGLLQKDDRTLLLTLTGAKCTYQDQVLFDPSWGDFDMALGEQVISVFGSAADREAYGETEDFVAKQIPLPKYDEQTLQLHRHYQSVRDWRESNAQDLESKLKALLQEYAPATPEDWLLRLEMLELAKAKNLSAGFQQILEADLNRIGAANSKKQELIRDGLRLAGQNL